MKGNNQKRFLEQLRSVFVPSTVLLMSRLGLTAYFPGVPPAKRPDGCPDEVAIVFYESQGTYTATRRSVSGRVYALLHESIFRFGNDGSWSAFPVPLPRRLRARKTYHLLNKPIDWYGGYTRLFIGMREPDRQDVPRFHRELQSHCAGIRANPGPLDGALVAVDDDYFVFWDHRNEQRAGDDRHLRRFEKWCKKVMSTPAADINANGQLFEPWDGIAIDCDQCLRLSFDRRALTPW